MMYVLTGPNDFARANKRRELVDVFVTKYGDLAFQSLDGEECDFDQIKEVLQSMPFLSPKKLVVLRSPGANKAFQEHHKELLSDLPDTTELIIDEPKFDKRSSYYKFCNKLDGFTEYTELDSGALQKWASEYVKKWDASIESRAAKTLIDRVGTDQLQLANELDKLSMFSKDITPVAIEELTVRTPTSTIFELIEAAFNNNKKQAIALYEEQRALQVDPMQIVAMFAWQFHVVALIKTAENRDASTIAKEAKLNPYVVQKSQRIASKMGLRELQERLSDLRQIDAKMKSTKLNVDDALKVFIISL
jgi:DNA polymerase III subunit delta